MKHEMPKLPSHPEHHSMTWTSAELLAIAAYGEQVAEPLLACIAELTASLETASATCIMLKQQQREGWAKKPLFADMIAAHPGLADELASGQEPVSEREAFEVWATRCNPGPDDYRLLRTPHANKPYAREWVRAAWEAWQFRATHGIMEQQ